MSLLDDFSLKVRVAAEGKAVRSVKVTHGAGSFLPCSSSFHHRPKVRLNKHLFGGGMEQKKKYYLRSQIESVSPEKRKYLTPKKVR